MPASAPALSAPPDSPARTKALEDFRSAIQWPVEWREIEAIVDDLGKDVVRAAVDSRVAERLQDSLVSLATRRAVLALGVQSLARTVVRKAIDAAGWPALAAALDAADNGDTARLAQAISAAALSLEDPKPPARAADAAHPPSRGARLAPPPERGQRAPEGHGTRQSDYRQASQAASSRPEEQAPSSQGGTVTQFGPRQPRGPRPAPAGADRPSYRRESAPNASVEGEGAGVAAAQPRRFQTVHVYNQTRVGNEMTARAAACFELTTRVVDERTGERQPALKIETAGKHPTQPTKYNWDDKIIFYLTEDELPQLLCVFLGLLPSCEFRNHGPQHNKSMKLENQGKHLYLTMAEGSDRKAAVQLDVGRSTRVATLVARAFQAVNDEIDWAAARDILTRLTAPMAKARAEAAQARRS